MKMKEFFRTMARSYVRGINESEFFIHGRTWVVLECSTQMMNENNHCNQWTGEIYDDHRDFVIVKSVDDRGNEDVVAMLFEDPSHWDEDCYNDNYKRYFNKTIKR